MQYLERVSLAKLQPHSTFTAAVRPYLLRTRRIWSRHPATKNTNHIDSTRYTRAVSYFRTISTRVIQLFNDSQIHKCHLEIRKSFYRYHSQEKTDYSSIKGLKSIVPPLSINPYSLFLLFLGKPNQSNKINTKSARIIGCKTCTPLACANAPTAKGKIAPPLPPKAAAKPMADTCKCLGSNLVITTTAAGNSGPKKKPCSETATADT